MAASEAQRSNAALEERALKLAAEVLGPSARAVDAENRFPHESVAALRSAGLLGYFVPPALGGVGGDLATYGRIASILGEQCLSTAMIWVMHAHQTAVLVDHGGPAAESVLADIASNGRLLASVTSEYGKGGEVLRAEAPLVAEGDRLRLRRPAPMVSYGREASYYLVTMRSDASRPPTDVSLVLVAATDGTIDSRGEWNAMGLRGTQSVPMSFDVVVDRERVIGESFRHAAVMTLIPAAQIGWSAAWLGGARGAFKRLVAFERERRSPKLTSALFLTRLARQRVSLDLVQSLLDQVTDRLDRLREAEAPLAAYEDITHSIAINNLKIAGSALPFEVADELVELAGVSRGYLADDPAGLERVFRDLRAATLMFSNERLLRTNGKLILVEASAAERLWHRSEEEEKQENEAAREEESNG